MAEKIKRACNFTSCEEQLLVNLVKEKYVYIIENKRTDSGSNRVKSEAWSKLAEEFISLSREQYRDAYTLKIKYNNLKKRTKVKFAQQKQYTYGTGGGPPKDLIDTDIDTSFKEIISTQITGNMSEFDSDATSEKQSTTQSKEVNISGDEDGSSNGIIEVINIDWPRSNECAPIFPGNDCINTAGSPESSTKADATKRRKILKWSSYTPNELQTPVSSPLKRRYKDEGSLRTKLGEWALAKKKAAVTSEQHVAEENSLKLQYLKEAHVEKLLFSYSIFEVHTNGIR